MQNLDGFTFGAQVIKMVQKYVGRKLKIPFRIPDGTARQGVFDKFSSTYKFVS